MEFTQETLLVLKALADYQMKENDPNKGHYQLNGEQLQKITKLHLSFMNDAVEILRESGLVEVIRGLGSYPYSFVMAELTPKGRFLLKKINEESQTKESMEEKEPKIQKIQRALNPVGSPYGFGDEDWEYIEVQKKDGNKLNVVFGLQWKSTVYETDSLVANIKKHFEDAIEIYRSRSGSLPITLNFKQLAAGFGEHLFNQIARDVISSDVAVFETSDKNPNVMIEMGVALTWGVRVLPIKREDKEKPPSDISGQTWADYKNNGDNAKTFTESEFQEKLIAMIDRAIKKKG